MKNQKLEVHAVFLQRQTLAAPMIAAGVPKQEVAKRLSVKPSTVTGWLKDPAFRLACQHEQRAMVSVVRQQLLSLGDAAAKAIRDVLNDPAAPASARIRAAEIVLDRLDDFHKIAERTPIPALHVDDAPFEQERAARLAGLYVDPQEQPAPPPVLSAVPLAPALAMQ